MAKREIYLLAAACFFGGIVIGFLFAPIKGGVQCGNNSGNTYVPIDCDDCLETMD